MTKTNQYLLLAFLLSFSLSIFASEKDDKSEKENHHSKHNHISIFGGWSVDFHSRVGPKIGIEYVRGINHFLALRGAADFTGKDYKDYSLSVNADFYPFDKAPFYFGAGGGAKYYHEKWSPFARLLVGYDFHIGQFSISPLLMYDIYNQKNYVTFGLGFGFGF